MVETRPELIVETGTYRGGSAFFLASICDLLGAGEIVSIDIEPVRDDYPAHPRITYLGGRSSTDPDVVATIRERAEGRRTLVVLDSDHSQAHVEAELAEYASLVPVGGYVIVEDSNIGQIRKDLLPGPLEAIEVFLATDGPVRDRPPPREVPDHVQPERLPPPRALGAGISSELRVRRCADDAHGAADVPEHEPCGCSLGDAPACEADPRLREDVVGDERVARRCLELAGARHVDSFDREAVRHRAADVGGAVDGRVEELGQVERMPLEGGSAGGIRRRASSRGRPSATRSSIQARSRPPAKTRSSGASIMRSHAKYDMAAKVAATATGSATRAMPTRQEERRGDSAEDEDAEGEAAGRRPRPRELRLDSHPQRAGDGIDARLVRELPEGQDQWERRALRRRRSRSRRAGAAGRSRARRRAR